MLNINDKEQEELFRILESNNSSDSLEDNYSSSFDSCYQSADDSSNSPNIRIGCRDSCCNVTNFVNTPTKGEENEKMFQKNMINKAQVKVNVLNVENLVISVRIVIRNLVS